MTLLNILILAVVQGACELLPISSSAHVIVAEKLMGLDPTAPEMTLLLVMLHTGTMLSVMVYFWNSWRLRYFGSWEALKVFAKLLAFATAITGTIGIILMVLLEHVVMRGSAHAEIEQLFGNTNIIAAGLAAVGVMIILSGRRLLIRKDHQPIGLSQSVWIGVVQGLCLPFRGFSRSGSTISMALLLGVDRTRAEDFSFALAVVLTPAVIAKESFRLLKAQGNAFSHAAAIFSVTWPSLLGMACSFAAGLVALKWLSRWLEHRRWHFFGYYCLIVAVALFAADKIKG
jgi:undecaprenyl-diphosphatase